ncbi:hypothetical protein VCHA35O135_160067 [Vibrio chagasii]|nr:hypothetical protein VCHA35O135_160067 [Vibrio chagasii]
MAPLYFFEIPDSFIPTLGIDAKSFNETVIPESRDEISGISFVT